jgi:hypothetical protein
MAPLVVVAVAAREVAFTSRTVAASRTSGSGTVGIVTPKKIYPPERT